MQLCEIRKDVCLYFNYTGGWSIDIEFQQSFISIRHNCLSINIILVIQLKNKKYFAGQLFRLKVLELLLKISRVD